MSLAMSVLAMTIMSAAADSAHAREERMWRTVQAENLDAFRAELDSEFVAVYAHAVNDGAGEVSAMAKQKLQSFELRDFDARPLSQTVELVTYTAAVKGSFEGADISGNYRATSVWKKDSSGWKLAYHSEIKIP